MLYVQQWVNDNDDDDDDAIIMGRSGSRLPEPTGRCRDPTRPCWATASGVRRPESLLEAALWPGRV